MVGLKRKFLANEIHLESVAAQQRLSVSFSICECRSSVSVSFLDEYATTPLSIALLVSQIKQTGASQYAPFCSSVNISDQLVFYPVNVTFMSLITLCNSHFVPE